MDRRTQAHEFLEESKAQLPKVATDALSMLRKIDEHENDRLSAMGTEFNASRSNLSSAAPCW